jgi:2-C-methyl-D-erythritol 4-phosphate cytidylyltransferase/2-C-methyl-D-erythritol 2,4-cyclodiphosphate synthase
MTVTPKTIAIVLAAGRGTRAGGSEPKQWQTVLGKPLLAWSLDAFLSHDDIDAVVLVHHPDDQDLIAQLPASVRCLYGGTNRDDSVRCALAALKEQAPDYILIHDAARPCVTQSLISKCLKSMRAHGAAAPAVAVQDTLWRGGDTVEKTVDRDNLWRAQTPQCFSYPLIAKAHAAATQPATDDVQIVRAAGHPVAIVPGDADNLKVTVPGDFARAERILRGRMKLRLGNGFDVHKFGPGTEITLCGITLPHKFGLLGHSDADVGMHAVTDAIYGALAQGDIGQHFPPSDPHWKGAPSDIFLAHAVQLAKDLGFQIENVDCTLICEFPKIGPHAQAMQARMAQIMGLDRDQISIKATTSETLGFTGREEGIAALATAALVSL